MIRFDTCEGIMDDSARYFSIFVYQDVIKLSFSSVLIHTYPVLSVSLAISHVCDLDTFSE